MYQYFSIVFSEKKARGNVKRKITESWKTMTIPEDRPAR